MQYKEKTMGKAHENWMRACRIADVAADSGVCIEADGKQLAVFNVSALGTWYAVDNRCPHWNEQVLARGLLGDLGGEPKVACPMHKRCYSLETGAYLNGAGYIATYPVCIEDGYAYVNTTPNNAT